MNLDLLAQYGILGLVAGALYIFAQGAVKRERERLDKAETVNDTLSKQLYDQTFNQAILQREQERANKAEMQRDASIDQIRGTVFPLLQQVTDVMTKTSEQVSLLLKAQEKAEIIRQYKEELKNDPTKP